MQVIPVLDVKNGIVVHARGGERSAYRPLATPLAAHPDPGGVVEGLLRIYPFKTLYIADLDGIMYGTPDLQTLHALSQAFPGLEIWLDNGAFEHRGVQAVLAMARVKVVIGSETLVKIAEYERLRARFGERIILSLDFRGETFLGPRQLLERPQLWPGRVIAMTMAAVGERAGPDLARVQTVKAMAPATAVSAAGGVRDRHDLASLAAAGADAALVATALHAGTLKAGDLVEIAGL